MNKISPIIEAELPFDPKQNEVVISQGFNGPYSHNISSVRRCRYDLRYALDFALPLGTQVSAACRGIVSFIIRGNGYYEGCDPSEGRKVKASSIIISHPDINGFPKMIFSHYQHLDPESIQVKPHDIVEPGQPLAKTGRVGWVGEIPHLHLHFQYHEINHDQGPLVTSIPFKLKGHEGDYEDEELIRGMVGDSRELVQRILSIRRRDGLLLNK